MDLVPGTSAGFTTGKVPRVPEYEVLISCHAPPDDQRFEAGTTITATQAKKIPPTTIQAWVLSDPPVIREKTKAKTKAADKAGTSEAATVDKAGS